MTIVVNISHHPTRTINLCLHQKAMAMTESGPKTKKMHKTVALQERRRINATNKNQVVNQQASKKPYVEVCTVEEAESVSLFTKKNCKITITIGPPASRKGQSTVPLTPAPDVIYSRSTFSNPAGSL